MLCHVRRRQVLWPLLDPRERLKKRPSFETREVDATISSKDDPDRRTVSLRESALHGLGVVVQYSVVSLLHVCSNLTRKLETNFVHMLRGNKTRIEPCSKNVTGAVSQQLFFAPLVNFTVTASVLICINALELAGSQSVKRELKPHRTRSYSCS